MCHSVKPHIDRKNLDKKTVRSGQMLRVEIDIEGEPAPTVTWTLNGQPVPANKRLTIDDQEYHSFFSLQRAKRSDTGVYVITATNTSGTDVAELDVNVLSEWTQGARRGSCRLKCLQSFIYVFHHALLFAATPPVRSFI